MKERSPVEGGNYEYVEKVVQTADTWMASSLGVE